MNTTIQYNSRLANNPKLAIALTVVVYLLLGFLERLPGTYLPPLLYFAILGVLALYIMPNVLGLPNGRKSLQEYCREIRLWPMAPLGRNILLGILVAGVTLSGILFASMLTGHFVLDWSIIPPVRWVKALTRGIWEEVFFRGIVLVLFMRIFPARRAILSATLVFAVAHLSAFTLDVFVDLISIFFMGLLWVYMTLKTNSLLPGIVSHYIHDVFIYLVQNTPGADQPLASALLYAFLWIALIIAGLLTRFIVERWPTPNTPTHPAL